MARWTRPGAQRAAKVSLREAEDLRATGTLGSASTDHEQRASWSNFSTGVVARGGINFRRMTAPLQEAR